MARRFTFRLEPVRALREQAEKQAQEALAQELAQERRCQVALDQAAAELRQAQAAGTARPGSSVSGFDLRARQAYVERIERERAVAAHGLARQERQVQAGRDRLKRAAAEHEALARLKQRRRDEHRRALDRVEEALLSEVGLAGHRRAAEASA